MDLLKGNVRQIYFRYLGAAFGSALISSIYGLVDSAMVGQYQGHYDHCFFCRRRWREYSTCKWKRKPFLR